MLVLSYLPLAVFIKDQYLKYVLRGSALQLRLELSLKDYTIIRPGYMGKVDATLDDEQLVHDLKLRPLEPPTEFDGRGVGH